jgi:hypothetical protein
VYNKEAVYQKKEFALLLHFCEMYAQRYAYDRQGEEDGQAESGEDEGDAVDNQFELSAASSPTRARAAARTSHNKKKHPVESTEQAREFVVDKLTDIRVDNQGEKQVQVQWEGYKRRTWKPFHSIRLQLPDMLAELATMERSLAIIDSCAS